MARPFIREKFIILRDDNGDPVYLVENYEDSEKPSRSYNIESGYLPFFLVHEAGDGIAARVSSLIPGEEDYGFAESIEGIKTYLRKIQPTLVNKTKDNTFAAVAFRDEEGNPRQWGELHTLELRPSVGDKMAKRLNIFGMSAYAYGAGPITYVSEGEKVSYNTDSVSVMILDDPDPDDVVQVDGQVTISESFRRRLVEAMAERLDGTVPPEKKAEVVGKHMATDVFTIRAAIPDSGDLKGGLIKGHAVVSKTQRVDIMAHRCNVAREVASREGIIYLLTPYEPVKKARLDRQIAAAAYDRFIKDIRTPEEEGRMNIVLDAFEDKVDREIDRLDNGELFGFVAPHQEVRDEMRVMQDRMHRFHKAWGISLSLYLTMAMIGQRIKMWRVKGDTGSRERKIVGRLPFPYALRVALKNATTFKACRVKNLKLEKGEAFIDPTLGLIIHDETWPEAIGVMGGGDLDDGGVVFTARTTVAFTFRGIHFNVGDPFMMVYRNPMGALSDRKKGESPAGKVLASEYYILRPTKKTLRWLEMKFGELPDADPSTLLPSVAGMTPPVVGRVPTPVVSSGNYTKQDAWNDVMSSTATQGAYSKHSASIRNHVINGHPFEFVAREETYIDIHAIHRNADDLQWMLDDTEEKNIDLASHYDTKEPTFFADLIRFYEQQVRKFEFSALDYLRELQRELKEACSGQEYGRTTEDGTPILVDRINRKLVEVNPNPNSFYEYEEFGNMLARRLEEVRELYPDRESEEQHYEDICDAFTYYLANTEVSERYGDNPMAMFRGHERVLMSGAMFDLLMESLAANKSS